MICFIPSYVLFAGLIITIGAVVGSIQEGQQLASLVMLPALLPLMLVGIIENQPDGVVAVAASLFPLTAPMTLMMRLALTEIPLWQIGLSVVILSLSAVLVILFAARLFRWGMLRYGKQFRMRDLFKHVWARRKKHQSAKV
jgi:ABC-2 type transport system permease protein